MTACRGCATPLPEGALFCGECGAAVPLDPPGRRERPAARSAWWSAGDRDAAARQARTSVSGAPEPRAPGPPGPSGEGSGDRAEPATTGSAAPAVPGASGDAEPTAPGRVDDRERVGFDVPSWFAATQRLPAEDLPRGRSRPAARPVSRHSPWAPRDEAADDATATMGARRAVRRMPLRGSSSDLEAVRSTPGSYVLHLPGGTTATVRSSTLLGRRPVAEPSERIASLVVIVDPERSVSKTHLELGVDDGRLWIRDRWSGNGTVIRRSDGDTELCEPGRRYTVRRGDVIGIGDVGLAVA